MVLQAWAHILLLLLSTIFKTQSNTINTNKLMTTSILGIFLGFAIVSTVSTLAMISYNSQKRHRVLVIFDNKGSFGEVEAPQVCFVDASKPWGTLRIKLKRVAGAEGSN